MEIKDLVQTCEACPSQWEAKTPDERGIYIRFRWGFLSISVSDNPGEHGLDGKEVYGEQLGDGLDGVISWDKVSKIIEKLPNKCMQADLQQKAAASG